MTKYAKLTEVRCFMKQLILVLMCSFCLAETLPIDKVTTLTGWFYEKREGYMHQALDIPANAYTPVRAVTTGKVTVADWDEEYGNYVDVADASGFYRYAHLQNYRTFPGDVVFEGQTIGGVGNTGRQKKSNKPMKAHLHLERRENGKKVFFTDRFRRDGERVYWITRD